MYQHPLNYFTLKMLPQKNINVDYVMLGQHHMENPFGGEEKWQFTIILAE